MGIDFGEVGAPYWDDDKPIAVVAGGRSLVGYDLTRLRGRAYVMAVKASIFDLPWADAGFGIDTPRLLEWADMLRDTTMQVYWATPDTLPYELKPIPCITYLRRYKHSGLPRSPGEVAGGGSSGYGALSIVWHKIRHQGMGRTIILFGFDYRMAKQEAPFRRNDQYYSRPRRQNPKYWQGWADNFAVIAADFERAGVRVINASPESTIDAFPRVTIEEAEKYLAGV